MPRNPLEPNSSTSVLASLPRPQKIAVLVLALFAILVIIFWVLQFRYQLTGPFQVNTPDSSKNAAANLVDPRLKDTDGDRLSDYDELNTYKTSPYLEDTDSDGILDGTEIKNGTDPNCPTGQKCNVPVETGTGSSSPASQSQVIPPVDLNLNVNASGTDTAILQNALNGQADAATLRQILIQSGIDKATLDQISDEDLMKSYQDTLSQQNKQ